MGFLLRSKIFQNVLKSHILENYGKFWTIIKIQLATVLASPSPFEVCVKKLWRILKHLLSYLKKCNANFFKRSL